VRINISNKAFVDKHADALRRFWRRQALDRLGVRVAGGRRDVRKVRAGEPGVVDELRTKYFPKAALTLDRIGASTPASTRPCAPSASTSR